MNHIFCSLNQYCESIPGVCTLIGYDAICASVYVDEVRIPGLLQVRFVCLSDTHGKTSLLPFYVPEGDILIHAGDFTMRGWAREGREFNNWLGGYYILHIYIYPLLSVNILYRAYILIYYCELKVEYR